MGVEEECEKVGRRGRVMEGKVAQERLTLRYQGELLDAERKDGSVGVSASNERKCN